MKKFAAIFISIMLVALMVFTPVASAAIVDDLKTAAAARTPENTGTLTLHKYTPTELASGDTDYDADAQIQKDQKPVTDAEFSAFRVLDLDTTTGLFTVNANFLTFKSASNGDKTLKELLLDSDDGLTFKSTELFGGTGNDTTNDGLIPELQYFVEENSTVATQVVKDSTNDADKNGTYVFKDLPLGIYLIVETDIPKNFVATSKSFLVSIPQWNEDHDNGTDNEPGAWEFDIPAWPKDDPVDLSKEIVDGTEPDRTTKGIGDKVPYRVVADLPNYGKDDYALTDEQIAQIKYTITDTMSKGLTFNRDLLAFIDVDKDGVYNAENSAKKDILFTPITTNNPNGDYTITVKDKNGATEITIDFVWKSLNPYQGLDLTLTYSATLNENAVIGAANTNEAELEYTNNPRPAHNDPTTGKTDKKKTSVFTYALDLTKTFNGNSASDEKVDASGVEFSLREYNTQTNTKSTEKLWFITEAKQDASGKWVNAGTGQYYAYSDQMSVVYLDTDTDGTYDTDADGKAQADPATPVTKEEGKALKLIDSTKTYIMTQKINPKSDGTLKVDGLDVGTYILTEENSISGWSKLAGDIKITVTSYTYTTQEPVEGSDTEETEEVTHVEMEYVDAKSQAGNENPRDLNPDHNDGRFEMTVNNVEMQFDLPLTGGAGLLAFTIGGGIVIAGAIIIFSMLRKKKTTV